jgi:multidrug efflux pump subunit AcrA (membrane-fusion protein)
MSTEPTLNADTIEQTKQQIRGLVSEIAQLSKSELEAEAYYPAFLEKVVSALAAVGGAVWVIREGRRLDLAYQIKMSETLLDSDSEDARRHFGLLSQAIASGEPHLIPPQSGGGDDQAIGNPTRSLLVLAPLRSDNQVEGLVEIFQRPDAQPVTQRGYLKFVVQMCELASEWLKTRKLRQISDRHSLWAQADHFARMVHENLDLRETAYTIVNEGRRIIGCDRVSVGVMYGRKCKIEAVSGQDTIENRSNIVHHLNQLATRVIATGESLWYDGSMDDLPPQVEESLHEYIDESHTRMLALLPLRRPKRAADVRQTVTGEADEESNLANEIVGALVVEQIESRLPEPVLRSRTDLVYEHAARAITNSIDVNRIFLMPVWRTVGKSRWLVSARTLPKTVLISAAVLALLLMLVFFKKDFNIQARGALQPVIKRDVFVPIDGEVIELRVQDKQQVEKDQLLVVLRNATLQVEYQKVVGELLSAQEQLSSAEYALLNQRGLSESDRIQKQSEARALAETVRALKLQQTLLEEKRAMLEIRAPIAGEVMIPWDVERSLERRPVAMGQVLMTIADPAGDWELELNMRENRSGKIRAARSNEAWRQRYPEAGERVSYILATDPEKDYRGTLRDVKDVIEIDDPEVGPIVKMKVEIKREDIGQPHPGSTVTAKVYCGRRAIGYVWFHEAWEWFQSNIVFYLS